MNQQDQLVKITLIKVPDGYQVEEKIYTKIKIPKTFLDQQKITQPKPAQKQVVTKPPPQIKQTLPPPIQPVNIHPPMPPQNNLVQSQMENIPSKLIWNSSPTPQNPHQVKQIPPQTQWFAQPQLPQIHQPPPQIQQPPQPQIPIPIQQPQEQQKQEIRRQLSKHSLIIPSCANWFQMESINEIEKEHFPEFFSNQHVSKTPELYKKQRNFIVNLYRSQPSTYLTTIACRKVLAGDACTISRIHGFLQYWGLINYSVDPDTCPNKVLPQQALTKGLYRTLQLNAKDELDEKSDLNQYEITLINAIKIFSKRYRPGCSFCGILCGLQWYSEKEQTQKEKQDQDKVENVKEVENKQKNSIKLDLCMKCFSNNNFPNSLTSEDFQLTNLEQKFQQLHILSDQPRSILNDQEVSYLISIIQETSDSNWEKLAQQLNQTFSTSHTEEELILHFLQYPIDHLIEIDKVIDSKECLEKLSINDISSRIAFEEPNVFSDQKNLVSFHLSIFKKLLNNLNKKDSEQFLKLDEVKSNSNNEDIIEEEKRVIQMNQETLERAKSLQKREEEKLNNHINLLISLQMEKLEHKLTFLEEYEKLILYEKQQLEICQKQTLAERLVIVQQKLQYYSDNNQ
ncbi:unnamed protein product [Paramecium pentaurelia]|uniref:SWIRM domain-containing protein n=1 Tax=Paramecium pentaurelia TaxID=43138 RepID=A0A8S1SSS7_9CILI|nr:unnamed protein product [Paramecium pentaurelia]